VFDLSKNRVKVKIRAQRTRLWFHPRGVEFALDSEWNIGMVE
jgi:hypothetical protein